MCRIFQSLLEHIMILANTEKEALMSTKCTTNMNGIAVTDPANMMKRFTQASSTFLFSVDIPKMMPY